MAERYDAVVIGAGPNGLTAATVLARAGRSVLVLEGNERVGGSASSAELTVPGVVHDVCAAVHPLGVASPAFAAIDLAPFGLKWLHPELAMAHPLDGERAAVLHRSVSATDEAIGASGRYEALVRPLVGRFDDLLDLALAPVSPVPAKPLHALRLATRLLPPAATVAKRLRSPEAAALVAGMAAHACIPLEHPLTAGLALVLATAGHVHGWPVAQGGTQAISDALAAAATAAGATIQTGRPVRSLAELPPHGVVVADVTPRQLAELAGGRPRWAGRYRYGAGTWKLDLLLSGPMPWTAPAGRTAGTVHLGGTLGEIAASERELHRGRLVDAPYVLVAQPTLADATRAPAGQHVLWAYCHVPNGSTVDASSAIEAQFDRFAPGWRDLVLARAVRSPAEAERHNPNLVGGDLAGGSLAGLRSVLRPRPFPVLHPYRSGLDGVYLCSASTPPGPGVHGMCGWHAAHAVLRDHR